MSETPLLYESYQNGIYWAVLNAEQARERAANAELDYWVSKKDGDLHALESSFREARTEIDGLRRRCTELEEAIVKHGENA